MWPYRNTSISFKLASCTRSYSVHSIPHPPKLASLETPQDMADARTWVSKFKALTIPKTLVEVTFSRSSGPGGQNVNKVNTKATLRCLLSSSWIPEWAHPGLVANPHYAPSTHSLIVQSTVYRSQSQNVDDCLSKLHDAILKATGAPIKNEPSEEQKRRVAAFERADKTRRRVEKSYRSSVKKGRSKTGWDTS